MQLRSIPPLTMHTLVRRRASKTMQERAAQFRQNLAALRESLQRIEISHRGQVPLDSHPMRLSFGSGSHGMGLGAGVGRRQNHVAPAKSTRSVDLLIPSRPGPNREPTAHTVTETADACVIGITFPVPVHPDEVRWERHGDVLEVEYMGAAFTYYHAFMVPAEREPSVEQEGRNLTFRFATNA